MNQRIIYLLKQFQTGEINATERQELLAFVDRDADEVSEQILTLIKKEEEQILDKVAVDKVWNDVLHSILSVDVVQPRRIPFLANLKWAAAACIAITISVGAYLYFNKLNKDVQIADIAPGGNKAVLTLANGKKISLGDIKDGELIKESGITISKTESGKLVYHIENTTDATDELKMNTISTPNGGEWEIHLPDGSDVWLNAASSIKYPLNISIAKERVVELTGEAYFEVKKDKKHPFIVKTEKQRLEVLGTHFNINSYQDDRQTRTTLFEGSVKVSGLENPGLFHLLNPGEQSVLSTSGIKVNTVNLDEAIAWKNGYFMFNNERQEDILKKIARWYNVQIEFVDHEAKGVTFYGTVSRFDKISKVLRKFEQTGEVRYVVKNNTVLVYKN